MGPFSVGGISWMHLLWGGNLSASDFGNSVVDAEDIVLNLPESQYVIRCGKLRMSMPHSEIVVEALKFHPSAMMSSSLQEANSEEPITTRRSSCQSDGFGQHRGAAGKMYRARSIQILDATFDILLNQDKPDSRDTQVSSCRMRFLRQYMGGCRSIVCVLRMDASVC